MNKRATYQWGTAGGTCIIECEIIDTNNDEYLIEFYDEIINEQTQRWVKKSTIEINTPNILNRNEKVSFELTHHKYPGVIMYGDGTMFIPEGKYESNDLRKIVSMTISHYLAYTVYPDNEEEYRRTLVKTLEKEYYK